ncbi:uncharacterized protein LOC110931404 [Helianthus annuus]|uniref:uncharacterized protein LOC110931404 n=1 Tax=Helianthus annuus TaxID=4232 RepID=UPI000B8FA1E6|nr:uncharacterized protein LOC110931404 [Helianthus annuus]
MNVFTGVGCMGKWDEATWCHFFPQTLTGLARAWFDSLPVGSLASFEQMQAKFLAHFSQQRRHKRDSMDVINIWRGDSESLESFLIRYNKECLEIGGIADQMDRNHFIRAVKYDEMVMTISGKEGLPEKWDGVMAAVKTYAQTQRSLKPHTGKTEPQVEGQSSCQDTKHNNKCNRDTWNRDNDSKPYVPRSYQPDARVTINTQRDQRASKKNQDQQAAKRRPPYGRTILATGPANEV